jgi:hypothetical protein
MNRLHIRRKLAILAATASLAGAGAAIGPAGASAHAGGSCGSKSISVSVKGGKPVQVAVSRIETSGGATCKTAYAVIGGFVKKKVPSGWRVTQGTFNVPHGLTAEMATKGKMLVKFALVGGSM